MLKQRIEILHRGGIVNDEIRVFMFEIIDFFKEHYPEIISETANMMITHLAMATQRILNQEIVETMDESTYDEIKQCAGYDRALQVMSYIEQHSVVIYPESEKQFIMLHLCNIL